MTKKILQTLVVTAVIVIAAATSVLAEGSRDLVANGGYRPSLEWNTSTLAGIARQTTLEVYVQKGESVYFGSSVKESFDGKDIVVIAPDGSETAYDVTDTIGLIKNTTMEAAGPAMNGNGGYSAFSFTAQDDGIWKFQFHAPDAAGTADPIIRTVDKNFPTDKTQRATVAAWDISVFGTDGAYKTGRVFTNYLAMNMGSNKVAGALNSILYVLTKDGYLYKTDMNGLDPFGFVFFANNRGLIDNTSGNTSGHYAPCVKNGLNLDIAQNLDISVVDPSKPDTDTYITHRVFFNVPSADLPESIPTEAKAPASVSKLKYTQNDDADGGVFTFKASRALTFDMDIFFDNDEYEDIHVSRPGTAGTNSVDWDGCDAAGNKVADGEYTVRIRTKSGEYHFSMIDVENNPNGIKIELQNKPYDVAGYYEDTIYYNCAPFTAANGQAVPGRTKGAPSPIDASEDGIRSMAEGAEALKYTSGWGNEYVVDMWTYFPGETSVASFNVGKTPTPIPTGTEIDVSGCQFAYIFGYEPGDEDGKLVLPLAPMDDVTREQVAAMPVRTLEQATDLLDDYDDSYELDMFVSMKPSRWSYHSLSYIASLGAFDGESGLWPDAAITRGEVAKLVSFALNLSQMGDISDFTDVEGTKYADYIALVYEAGYMNGNGDGTFSPDKIMTRAEFCTMFNNILGRSEDNGFYLETPDGTPITHATYYFTDMDSHVGAWYYEEMLYATSAFDDDGYVDVETRLANIRNILDKYNGQTEY
ncbi:MAG: S-layer homology domain-containing protein [Clostridia bacterium]|nr:S-layer homology domain-containing protein [Clostridia bacterium]